MGQWVAAECALFNRDSLRYPELSNMTRLELRLGGFVVPASENLYQACRFPHLPELQRAILAERDPMVAKSLQAPHRHDSRADWDEAARVPVMRWVLELKLAQHAALFRALFDCTGARPIVEHSPKDAFWGAIGPRDGVLAGRNELGRLFMQLRAEWREGRAPWLHRVVPPPLPDFRLCGADVPVWESS